MTAAEIVKLALIVSIIIVVASLGARTAISDAVWLVQRPLKLLRAVTAIYLVVPAFAIWLCMNFPIDPAVKIAIVALSVSPIPPLLPQKQEKAGSSHAYAVSLLVTAAVLSLGLTPLGVNLAGNTFGIDIAIAPVAILKVLALTILAPLSIGIGINRFAPALAKQISAHGPRIGMALLTLAALVMLSATWRGMFALIGNGTVLAIIATVVLGLVAGHFLAGDGCDDRAALAIAASSRHPGLAIAIASANFADQSGDATAAILLFLLINALVTIPYIRWVRQKPEAA